MSLLERGKGTLRRWDRVRREALMIGRALAETDRPVLAHVIPTRRCNLACAYCNEYDAVSEPVPFAELAARLDRLAELGTLAVTLSGGEPLLHPELGRVVRRIRERGMLASLITNGYLLSVERIDELNRAGLDQLQISIDNLRPDGVSVKSLKVLESKLRLLARHAWFSVNINAVMGAEISEPEDALRVAELAEQLGFSHTLGILHDGRGQVRPLGQRALRVYELIARMRRPFWVRARNARFQARLVRGEPNSWHCGAGGRYLYVCEEGLVHRCSQQRGTPGVPLESYTRDDVLSEAARAKSCAPMCTVGCVQQVAMIDQVRSQPREALIELLSRNPQSGSLSDLPLGFRVLARLFLPEPGRRPGLMTRLALRLLGVRRGVGVEPGTVRVSEAEHEPGPVRVSDAGSRRLPVVHD